ncbi:MAG: 50S ribosomal protein L29 [Crocinitomicaceae bacterium]|nr:50S ribosomal protein L29 [Crocinitomicaceae bacterium]
MITPTEKNNKVKNKEFNIKLNGLTIEELREMLANTQSNLNKIKMNHRTAELENPLEIRSVRRNVARILTEINKRELQQSSN